MDLKTSSIYIKQSTTTEHNGTKLEPCNHIDVISIPSDILAFVSFTESPKENKMYPLKNNSQLDLTFDGGSDVYLWTIGTSADNIELILSTLGNENNVIIKQSADRVNLSTDIADIIKNLEKTINPYQQPILTLGKTNSTSVTTILNKILTCDKIRVNLSIVRIDAIGGFDNHHGVALFIDNEPIIRTTINNGYVNDMANTDFIDIENVKGKTITIKGMGYGGYTYSCFTLQEYTLKP